MDRDHQGQVSRRAAEVYEELLVPAMFLKPARYVAKAAEIRRGDSVLDVACGTGVLAREAASYTGDGARVTGLDRNDGMLSVARRMAPELNWHHGIAEALPFKDGTFDRVLCQFGLMFFDDRTAALREMQRVTNSGGRMVITVWGPLERATGHAAMVSLLDRLFGVEPAEALRAPFSLGSRGILQQTFASAGVSAESIETIEVRARFPSLDAWIQAEAKGWIFGGQIDEDRYQAFLRAARRELAGFQQSDETVALVMPMHIATVV
jgi:SAM-dependent methyltransferase